MTRYQSFSAYDAGPCVAAIGMFDGLHAGHRALLQRAAQEAQALGVPLTAVTYERHPLSVLRPEIAPKPLMTLEEKLAGLEASGVDAAIVCPFTAELAATPAEDFLRALCAGLAPRALCVGYNHTFGRGGKGNAALIERMSGELGYRAVILPPVERDGAPVSSSRIRALLAAGDEAAARRLLAK